LHTGSAIVGSIGSPERLEFTAVGDTVNMTSRIEALTKTTGRSLLVSRQVRGLLDDPGLLEELPPQTVKGVDEPVVLYALRS
jgi:adenylate cyclase